MPDKRSPELRQRDATLIALLAYSGVRPSEASAFPVNAASQLGHSPALTKKTYGHVGASSTKATRIVVDYEMRRLARGVSSVPRVAV
jgi:hypothetical protein